MQKLTYSMMLLVALIAQPAFAEEERIITAQDKRNYEIGVQLVRVLSRLGGEINLDMVIKGMRDALRNETLSAGGGSGQAAGPARIRPMSKNRQRPLEKGRAEAGADAAARMTISGGAGRITATPAWPPGANPYRYLYQGYSRTR